MTTNGPATVDVSALAEACEVYTAAYLSREEEVSPELVDDIRRALGVSAELADVQASREAWAIEADRLDIIATAAEYHTGPEECCDSECDHLHDDEGNFIGTDGEWCPHVEMRHATAEDAIEAHKVPLLEAQIERLDREAADGVQFREAVAAALKVSPILSNGGLVSAIARLTRERDEAQAEVDAVTAERDKLANDLGDLNLIHSVVTENEDDLRHAGHRIAGLFNRDPEDHQIAGVLRDVAEELIVWRTDSTQVPDGWRSLVRKGWSVGSRPAIPADALAKPDGVLYALLRVWLDSPLNRESPESAAAAAASAVNWFLRAAPVSGSDTTEDGAGRG